MTAPSIMAARLMGESGSDASVEERIAFEAWVSGHNWSLGATWDGKGYRHDTETGTRICHQAMLTRMMWSAWRDRAALAHNASSAPTDQ